jgi:hypothetical protein
MDLSAGNTRRPVKSTGETVAKAKRGAAHVTETSATATSIFITQF